MFTYNLITEMTSWDAIGEEWNQLLDRGITRAPFLRNEFLREWWLHLGGGEWSEAELAIITATDQGNLIGIAPFFITGNPSGERTLMFLGSHEIVDFLDFIVEKLNLDDFLSGLLDFLAGQTELLWHKMDLYNLLDQSPTQGALERLILARGWQCTREELKKAPYIVLPGDWEMYLAGIDKKQRHEIRRKIRRAEESGYQTSVYFSTEPDRLEQDIVDFFRLMAQDPEKEAFLSPRMRAQMAGIIRCAFEQGYLQLAFLEIGGERASAYLNFNYLNRIWVYNSGINRQLNEYSPGWVLLGYLLKWSNENGYNEFDFLRGNEDYKYRFGAVDRAVQRMIILRKE